MDQQVKRTVWFERYGYFEDSHREGQIRYRVTKLKNSITPLLGECLDAIEVDNLINDGYTVNIS